MGQEKTVYIYDVSGRDSPMDVAMSMVANTKEVTIKEMDLGVKRLDGEE